MFFKDIKVSYPPNELSSRVDPTLDMIEQLSGSSAINNVHFSSQLESFLSFDLLSLTYNFYLFKLSLFSPFYCYCGISFAFSTSRVIFISHIVACNRLVVLSYAYFSSNQFYRQALRELSVFTLQLSFAT